MEALIVVSNRLPFVLHRDRESGGLRRKCRFYILKYFLAIF